MPEIEPQIQPSLIKATADTVDADKHRQGLNDITEQVIGCAYQVSNVLGCGFLEKVYENALVVEMRRKGLSIKQQHSMEVLYDGEIVGEYLADILVEERVIVELKAVKNLDDVHVAQCMNYLNATALHVCLLMNFGKPKVEVRRIVRDF